MSECKWSARILRTSDSGHEEGYYSSIREPELELLLPWVQTPTDIFIFIFFNWNYNAQIKPSDIMEVGAKVYVPVSVAENKISKRFDIIPSGTLNPNADEIAYLRRLVKYKVCLLIKN